MAAIDSGLYKYIEKGLEIKPYTYTTNYDADEYADNWIEEMSTYGKGREPIIRTVNGYSIRVGNVVIGYVDSLDKITVELIDNLVENYVDISHDMDIMRQRMEARFCQLQSEISKKYNKDLSIIDC